MINYLAVEGQLLLTDLTVDGSSSSELVRITQTGSGNALVVEDSANPDGTPFVIDASGYVGIGTATPLQPAGYGALTIDGSSGSIISGRVAGTETFRIQSTATSTALNNITALPILFNTNNAERMRITSAGNVGIGTAIPTEKLDVAGNIALTGSVVFEGATADGFETTLSVTDPTDDRTITLPNASGTVALIAVSDTAPVSPSAGNLWFKSNTGTMYVYYDSFWIEVGSPSSGLDGGSA